MSDHDFKSGADGAQPLVDMFHDWLAACIDEKGAGLPHALVRLENGTITVMALDLEPDQIYRLMLAEWMKAPSEIVFAIDRFAKPEQGTELRDLVAGWHFTRERPIPFIVEYQHEPRIVRAVHWDNEWWNAALNGELLSHLRLLTGVSGWSMQ